MHAIRIYIKRNRSVPVHGVWVWYHNSLIQVLIDNGTWRTVNLKCIRGCESQDRFNMLDWFT